MEDTEKRAKYIIELADDLTNKNKALKLLFMDLFGCFNLVMDKCKELEEELKKKREETRKKDKGLFFFYIVGGLSEGVDGNRIKVMKELHHFTGVKLKDSKASIEKAIDTVSKGDAACICAFEYSQDAFDFKVKLEELGVNCFYY